MEGLDGAFCWRYLLSYSSCKRISKEQFLNLNMVALESYIKYKRETLLEIVYIWQILQVHDLLLEFTLFVSDGLNKDYVILLCLVVIVLNFSSVL